MNCDSCKYPFDKQIRIPKLLPNCGHSICSYCLTSNKSIKGNYFQCKLDGISYKKDQNYNDNLFIINQIREQNIQKNACRIHKKQLNIFCFDCKIKICVNCVLFGSHKMHNYNEVNTIDQQNNQTENQLEDKISLIDKKYFQDDNNICSQIDQIKFEQKERVIRLFTLLKNTINFTEKKYLERVENSDIKIKELIQIKKQQFKEIKQNFIQIKENQDKDIVQKDQQLKQVLKESDNLNFDQFINQFQLQVKKQLHLDIKKNLKQELKKFCNTLNIKNSLDEPMISEEEIDLLKQTLSDLPINTSLNDLKFNNLQQSNISQNQQEKISDFSFSDLQSALQNQSNYSIISKNSNISKNSSISKNSIFITNKKNYQNKSGFQDITNQIKVNQSQKRMTVRNPSKLHDKENKNIQNINKPLEKICQLEKIEKFINKINIKKKSCLDLSKQNISDDVMKSIAYKIKTLDKIKTIKLNYNQLTELGIKYLLKSIKNLNVEFLFMTHNNLDDTCIDYLISFKKYNKKLKAVYITNNPLSKKGQQLKSKIQILESKNVALVF